MGGSRLVRARTAVGLPVPLRPQMRTPPIEGSMALRMRASRMFCCPTIALNGNVAMFVLSSPVQRCVRMRYTSTKNPHAAKTLEYCNAITWLRSCQNDTGSGMRRLRVNWRSFSQIECRVCWVCRECRECQLYQMCFAFEAMRENCVQVASNLLHYFLEP